MGHRLSFHKPENFSVVGWPFGGRIRLIRFFTLNQLPYRLLIGVPVYLSAPGGRLSTFDPSLSNRDLAPTTPEQRTWTMYNYIALWFSMSMEITTYQLASSLIAKGMDWKQALGTVLLGNLIVLVPMLLNAHAGAKYGIPFPVL